MINPILLSKEWEYSIGMDYHRRLILEFEYLLHCSCSFVLTYDDEMLEYYVYEELNGEYFNFNPKANYINDLKVYGVINYEIEKLLPLLYKKIEYLFNVKFERSGVFIRLSIEWKEVFEFADKIAQIYFVWVDRKTKGETWAPS